MVPLKIFLLVTVEATILVRYGFVDIYTSLSPFSACSFSIDLNLVISGTDAFWSFFPLHFLFDLISVTGIHLLSFFLLYFSLSWTFSVFFVMVPLKIFLLATVTLVELFLFVATLHLFLFQQIIISETGLGVLILSSKFSACISFGSSSIIEGCISIFLQTLFESTTVESTMFNLYFCFCLESGTYKPRRVSISLNNIFFSL